MFKNNPDDDSKAMKKAGSQMRVHRLPVTAVYQGIALSMRPIYDVIAADKPLGFIAKVSDTHYAGGVLSSPNEWHSETSLEVLVAWMLVKAGILPASAPTMPPFYDPTIGRVCRSCGSAALHFVERDSTVLVYCGTCKASYEVKRGVQ